LDFRGKDAEHAASPATMRHVRCIPDGTKVPRTGHPDPAHAPALAETPDLLADPTVRPDCGPPPDLTRLDGALDRTALRLTAGAPIKIVAIGSSSTAGAGASCLAPQRSRRRHGDLRPRADSTEDADGTAVETRSEH
jgi:hypothetical protein